MINSKLLHTHYSSWRFRHSISASHSLMQPESAIALRPRLCKETQYAVITTLSAHLYQLVKYSTWNIMQQYFFIWIFITQEGIIQLHSKWVILYFYCINIKLACLICLIYFPARHNTLIIDVTNLQAWGMRVQVLSAYKAVTFKWTWHDSFCHWVVV